MPSDRRSHGNPGSQFKAAGSFHLTSRDLFVVYGDMIEGEVRAGMLLGVTLNGSLNVTGRIASVEFVDIAAAAHG
jgi:hypothetical protein